MADGTSTTDAKDAGAKAGDEKGQTQDAEVKTDADIEEIAAQAAKPDAVKAALVKEREAAKEARKQAEDLAAKVREFEDRDKTETQKLEDRATKAEDRASTAEFRADRLEVALAKKLPVDLALRLQGKDKKELEEDADRLLELVKPETNGDVDAGKGDVATGKTFNDLWRAGAR